MKMRLDTLKCPACGEVGLEVVPAASGNVIVCAAKGCSMPTAAGRVLSEHEIDHIAYLGRETYTVIHPLMERIGGMETMHHCPVNLRIRDNLFGAPNDRPGFYRVKLDEHDPTSESRRRDASGLELEWVGPWKGEDGGDGGVL